MDPTPLPSKFPLLLPSKVPTNVPTSQPTLKMMKNLYVKPTSVPSAVFVTNKFSFGGLEAADQWLDDHKMLEGIILVLSCLALVAFFYNIGYFAYSPDIDRSGHNNDDVGESVCHGAPDTQNSLPERTIDASVPKHNNMISSGQVPLTTTLSAQLVPARFRNVNRLYSWPTLSPGAPKTTPGEPSLLRTSNPSIYVANVQPVSSLRSLVYRDSGSRDRHLQLENINLHRSQNMSMIL